MGKKVTIGSIGGRISIIPPRRDVIEKSIQGKERQESTSTKLFTEWGNKAS